ncbi:MAG: iron-sulfur cluster assembly scaffold protein [Mycoplasmatales bacterium]|nr:iron-sulfur cluster assembly scaffold protein [Mycoplasmatales bacterium]
MVKRKIIMERYSNPIHKGKIEKAEMIERFSTQCVDKMKLFLKWEKNILVDAKHESVGCAVFLSSLDLFIDYIIGKNKEQIKDIVRNYNIMINQSGEYNKEQLDKLIIFDNVKTHLNRLLCANMISETLKSI